MTDLVPDHARRRTGSAAARAALVAFAGAWSRRRMLWPLVAAYGVAVPAHAAGLSVTQPMATTGVAPFAPCSAVAGCSVLPPPTGHYVYSHGSVRVAFTLADRVGSARLVIRGFRFTTECRHRTARVTQQISVGAHYQFRLSSRGGITIRGSFVAGRYTGDLFTAAAGLARGTVHVRSSGCDSGAIRFNATN